ncbi:g protein alpha i subunit [Anaeramoeba ignava]|uniref:G protein alpha i subunit n=1 Tax=Anaeramoeba ignava TaxID=1746090 RepID=A0A9Q0LBB1_ANAIG|nr:g protein alpha i subunit [Anaeramoeba ignava]
MGNCATKNDGASSRTQKIDEELKQSRVALDNEIKILLLGAGDSGKSTLLKQMKIIHGKGFNEEERREFTERVQENIIQNMKSLVVAAEHFKLDVLEENEEKAEYFRALSPRENTFSEEVIDNVIALWKDPAIQQTLTRSSEFQLNNTAAYFFNRIEEIRKEDYIPSIDDVLRVRVKTTGISTQN